MFVSCVSISGRQGLKILESVHAVKGMIGMKKKRKKGGAVNDIERLMGTKGFTSREFNEKLNSVINYSFNNKATLDFLKVSAALGMVKCVGWTGNQYYWEVIMRGEK